MHIAVLFYGRINKFKDHHSNLLESLGTENTVDFFYSGDNEPDHLITEFIDLYKPIQICNDRITDTIENQLHKYQNPPSPGHSLTNIHNMTRHFINKARVFKILEDYTKKEHIHYDIVCSMRIDLLYKEQFNFKPIEENTIYIPKGSDWADNGVNDQVAYANQNTMKKYMNIYENMIELLDSYNFLHPETLTYYNIKRYNINTVRFTLSYEIIR